ncbi:hypothetical protein C8F01DRAFT_1370495 [Mycena amicta]|nr:hypothetical protein C8F01DRAFT_1370495 [Mycena amicta]
MVAEDPRLPPELEREIFETTARMHPEMRYRLLFVSRRVLIWIEPTLYRTIVFANCHRLSQLLMAKSSEFFAKTTRHASVSIGSHAGAGRILEVCAGVTHLALTVYDDDTLYAPFRALQQIRRLTFYPGNVLLAATARDPTLPVFASLTHIHLFDNYDHNLASFCAALPVLTHLAVYGDYAWLRILADCKKLTLLVLLALEQHSAVEIEAQVGADLADPRVVVTWYKTWDEGVLDCYSYWDVAGDFAARKRQGLIKESCFLAERD